MIAEMIIDMKREKVFQMFNEVFQDQTWRTLWVRADYFGPDWVKTWAKKDKGIVYCQSSKSISFLTLQISQSKKSAVKNVIPDFNEKDKKLYPPET